MYLNDKRFRDIYPEFVELEYDIHLENGRMKFYGKTYEGNPAALQGYDEHSNTIITFINKTDVDCVYQIIDEIEEFQDEYSMDANYAIIVYGILNNKQLSELNKHKLKFEICIHSMLPSKTSIANKFI